MSPNTHEPAPAMTLRGLWVAMQFLTRLPTPRPAALSPSDFARSAAWFPLVGAFIGVLVVLIVLAARSQGVLIGGALGVLAWAWLTGALHLDGLADLADALAASHRDRERFLAVLADPHAGTVGVVSVALVLLLKFATLAELSVTALVAVPLVLAWSRTGPLAWGRWLPALKPGLGEQLARELPGGWIVIWTLLLIGLSVAVAPALCAAPLVIAAWGAWLRARLGGMTGDCLGAGVEVTEVALLLMLALIDVPGFAIADAAGAAATDPA